MRRHHLFATAVTATAALTLFTGCGAGVGSSSTSGDKPTAASTQLSSSTVTLKLMSTPESGAATKATIAAFEAKYPKIKVEYSQVNYTDYNKSVNLNLQSKEAPDIALLNSVANTVKDKLVLNLDDYAKLYGWDTSFPSNELNQWRVAADGTTLGEGGSLAAAPAGFSLVGLYYNKQALQKLGIATPPATLADLDADLAKAKAAGVLGLQLGDAEGHASFVVQSIAQSIEGADAANAWAYGHTGQSFANAANRTGAQTLVDWQKKGYLPDVASVNATKLQDAVNNFVKGQGLFFVDGIWDAKTISAGLGADAGFVPFPGEKATGIGTSVAYAIAASSKHPNEAAAFLNFLQSPEASAQQFAQGFMPDDPSAATPQAGTLQADIVSAWAKVAADNGLVAFNNNATATMNDTLTSGTQELLAGRTTADQFVQSVQDDWAKTHGN